ncbi:MAG: HAMP domain-containing protein [Clostridia bacterium]|nr:HAMP domain-containing protein [Clostridia bacterium]
MKNFSINSKLFFWFAFLVIFVVLTILILNTTVLESYYLHFKEKNLVKIYNDINLIYTQNENEENLESELEKIEINQNIDIVIKDNDKLTIYTTSRDFSNNMFKIPEYNRIVNDDYFSENLSGDISYFIETIRDNRINSDFIALFGKLSDNHFLFIRTPVQSIKEGVQVTNSFLLIIGAIALILSSLLAFIISKTFTKPIKQLNTIAKNISELNFSEEYTVTSSDEIGTLGQSINNLSHSLKTKIEELHEANIELEKDVEQKSKLAQMRSQFISDVSHELKTPIALIQGYAEGLIDGIATTDEDKKYYLEVILDEANKMSALTHDLLDLSNLEYGKNNLNIQTFDICELIGSTIKKNEIIFHEHGINASFTNYEINPDEIINVNADSFRIEQVLINYINNAIKNIDEKKLLKISVEKNDNIAKVKVFNSGNHITPENLMRIWNKFYKVDSSRNREQSGSGIGLSLVKAIMDQHKNNYGVENVEEGVVFWFELNCDTSPEN